MITQNIVEVTIANGASLSSAVNLQGGRLVGVMMPADWTAADLTFQAGLDDTTLYNLYDDEDAEVTVQASDDRFIVPLAPAKFLGVRWLKVRSGTAGSPVNQGAARTIKLVTLD